MDCEKLMKILGQEFPSIKLVGQEIPLNVYLVLLVIVISLLMGWIEHVSPGTFGNTVRAVARNAVGNKYDAGSKKPLLTEDRKLFRFWTPGENTWKSASEKDRQSIERAGKKPWYTTTNDILVDFGAILKKQCRQVGYNRSRVWGEGRSGLKTGWMWDVDMPKDCQFDIKTLTELYKEYFHRNRGIYIEKHLIFAKRHQAQSD